MAENISELIQNVRTMEDIQYLLTILFTNLNNQNEMYYDMFLNPTPMDIDLQRYNEKGELVAVSLPNRAKERITSYSGVGSPEGRQVASVGALYVDTQDSTLYYKATGGDSAYGWSQLVTTTSLPENPTGDGSQLTNLNVDNVTAGTLKVANGGTGNNQSITGILKGNGTQAFSTALPGVDYLDPLSMLGIICYYPIYVNDSTDNYGIPRGWLICDGKIYNMSTYPKLGAKLGNKYGGNGTTTFAVPDLTEVYIKGSKSPSNIIIDGTVGSHAHTYSGTTSSESSHTHGPGTLDATGQVTTVGIGMSGKTTKKSGVLKSSVKGDGSAVQGGWDNDEGYFNGKLNFKLSDGWVSGGQTGAGSAHSHAFNGTTSRNTDNSVKNEVDHIPMVPIIYSGSSY